MADSSKPVIRRCKRLKGCNSKTADDRISQLSDTTLAKILSSLNVKEAARCSVLSSRWTGLWKQTTRLDFDESKALYKFHCTSEDIHMLKPSRSEYITWVNHVLSIHESPTLDEFRVQYDLDAKACEHIDQWIKYAISKRVKKLHVDLTSYSGGKKYAITRGFFDYLKSPANLSDVQYLTSLYLNGVNINGEVVEYLLSNCPHLERLDISFSRHLVKLKVVGPSLSLKYLRLHVCRSLESIELSAPKLTTFHHNGKPPVLVIGNNPLLTELYIGGHGHPQIAHALDGFSNLLSQLETVEFSINMRVEREPFKVAEFSNLRQLTLEICAAHVPQSLMPLADLIFAAPLLQKFTLELFTVTTDRVVGIAQEMRRSERHKCLKEIEVGGFRRNYWVTQLLDSLFLNTCSLEKVVIDPYGVYWRRRLMAAGKVEGGEEEEVITTSRTVAKELLKKNLPRGVKLVVK